MSGTISFNPYTTNQPQDAFLLETQGYVQGALIDDTSSREWLMEGVLASTETLPMWGGVAVSEYVNLAGANADSLGPSIKRATASIAATGFSIFNQMMHMVIAPGQTVPLAGTGAGVGFVRFGSNARIAVQIDPALVTALQGTNQVISNSPLYWDVVNYRVTATSTSNAALGSTVKLLSINTNSKIVSWSSPNATWTTGTAAIILI